MLVLRKVQTSDFMTAEWARLPPDVLVVAGICIVGKIAGVGCVVE